MAASDRIVLFDHVVETIERAYAALGHTLGWRFLYTPAQTLAPDAPLLFVGLNPGGRRRVHPQPSVEAGNAYRVEPWRADGELNPLQRQVCALYERIASCLDGVDRDMLMDTTPAANFCPFRSPSWAALPNKTDSVAFSSRLWARIFDIMVPPAIVCLTGVPARHFSVILRRSGWTEIEQRTAPIGWGAVRYSIRRLKRADRETVIVRLPHLARFRIFGRPESEVAEIDLARTLAQGIRCSTA